MQSLSNLIMPTPPKLTELSEQLLDRYTQSGSIPIRVWYMDESVINVDHLYKPNVVSRLMEMAKSRMSNYYGQTDYWLYEALSEYPIKNKDVLIIGSIMPWYESISLSFGCKSCTVVEYRKQSENVPDVTYIQPDELKGKKYDCILSISSYEHDGLGRYGDPLNPNGDLESMAEIKNNLIDGGLMYIAVPMGKDEIVWNAHRVYGKIRLPQLISGWDLIAKYGVTDKLWETTYTNNCPAQPVLVLRKKK